MSMPPIREMTARDRGFVVSTWRGEYGVRNSERKRLVEALLDVPSVRVLCIASDERTVHAWLAGQGDVMHYAYTAPELQRKGFARHLVRTMFGDHGPLLVTHAVPRGLAPRARLNPYQLAGCMSEREAA